MDKSRSSKLTKSKSSNGAMAKATQKNKKSYRSNGVLETILTKKRGVYVERKPSEQSLGDRGPNVNIATQKERPPRRPNRGQKRFLSTVFTLLSKSSAGTQHPDITNNSMLTLNKTTNKINDTTTRIDNNEITTLVDKMKKKTFRSRILNSRYYNNEDDFQVIHTRKDIQTPSIINSEYDVGEEDFDKIKWSDFLPRIVKPDEDEINLEKERKLSQLLREVTEGRMMPEKKNVKIEREDPLTLVSDTDAGLYNFFVDLLETTFSVYNVNAEYNALPTVPSAISSKVAFEIDESVAKRLNSVSCEPKPSKVDKPVKPRYLSNDGQELTSKQLPDHFETYKSPTRSRQSTRGSPVRNTSKKKPAKSDFALPKHKSPPYSQSEVNTQKKTYKKNSKKVLLNMLKEQLKMDDCPFEEPQNLYEALKVMAKTKRKSQKTIRFDNPAETDHDKECRFKSRKVISPVTKLRPKQNDDTRKPRAVSPRTSEFVNRKRRYPKVESSDDEPSHHSLEVLSIDYDKRRRRRSRLRQRRVTDQSPSVSEQELTYNSIVQQLLSAVEAIRHRRHHLEQPKDL